MFCMDDPILSKYGENRWKCGAYILKYKLSKQDVYVIIDDQLPVDQNEEWLLGHAQDQTELWPNILQ